MSAPGRTSSQIESTSTGRGFDKQWEKKKFMLNDNCKLEFMKKGKVNELTDNYILVHHPYP